MTRPNYVPDDAVDITDYGATSNPDDSSAQTAQQNAEAIQDAADAAGNGGSIYIPSGTYYICDNEKSQWTYFGGSREPSGMSIYGAGSGESTIGVSSHMDVSNGTLFIYHESDDHGTITIRGIEIDGNAENIPTLSGTGYGSRALQVDGTTDSHVEMEDCHIHDTYNGAVRLETVSANVEYCTFERTAIQLQNDAYEYGSHATDHHVTTDPANGNLQRFYRVKYRNCAGNCNNQDSGGVVRNEWCYAEGMGVAWNKHSEGLFELQNCYAEPSTTGINDLLSGNNFDGWSLIRCPDATEVAEANLDNVEVRSTTSAAIQVQDFSPSNNLKLRGDLIAIHNTTLETNRKVFFEASSDVRFEDMDINRLSIHNSTEDLFETPNGNGTIETLYRGENSGTLGETGGIEVLSDNPGAAPLEPDVPSADEVGHNAGQTTDSNDEPASIEISTDFGENTLGETPAGWTEQWSAADNFLVESSPSQVGDQNLTLRSDEGKRAALANDEVGDVTDAEVLALIHVPDVDWTTTSFARPTVRGAGGAGSETGIFLDFRAPGDFWRTAYYDSGGSMVELDRWGNPQPDTWYWVRFNVSGDTVQGRVWEYGGEEPASWDSEVQDSTIPGSGGWTGVSQFSEHEAHWDYISIASGDENVSFPAQEENSNPVFEEWTPQWASTEDDWSVVADSEYDGGHALTFDADDRTRHALSWDQVGTPSDVEVVDKFRVPNFASDTDLGFHGRVYLRSGTTNGSEEGYWIEIEDRENAFRLGKYTEAGMTTLGRFDTPKEGTFYYRRFRAEGTKLKAKVWPVNEDEPSDWDIEVTDDSHSGGWIGLGSFDPQPVETDVFSVATGGETVNLAQSDNAPSVAWASPTGDTILSGEVTVQIDASDAEDGDDTLLVEYQVNDGSWAAASYNSDTGYYEDTWDSTAVADGDHTLTAGVTDSAGNTSETAVTVSTDNSGTGPTVEGLSLSEVETTNADAEFDVDWQVSDSDGNLDSVDLLLTQADGTTEDTATVSVSGGTASGTTRLVAADDDGSGADYTVELTATDSKSNTATDTASTTETEDSGSAPTVSRFSVSEAGRPDPHAEITSVWDVSDADGDLATVDIDVADSTGTVQSVNWSLHGPTASDTDTFRLKDGDGESFEVTLTVTDATGKTATATRTVTA